MKSKTKKEISLLGIASLLFCLILFIGFLGPAITGFTSADGLISIPIETPEESIVEEDSLISIPTETAEESIAKEEAKVKIGIDNLFGITAAPTHSQPVLNSTTSNNYTTENITCYNVSSADTDGNTITNIYNWYRNNKSIMLLNMPFNHDDSGGVNQTKDYSGYNNSGQLGAGANNDAAEPTWTSSGKVGGAYTFDGTDDYIHIPHDDTHNTPKNFTVEAWFKTNITDTGKSPHSQVIICRSSSGFGNLESWALYLFNESIAYFVIRFDGASSRPIGHATNFSDNQWHHMIGAYNGSYSWLYYDGLLVNETDWGVIKHANNGTMPIGIGIECNLNQRNFNGTLDEIRIYNHTLSTGQMYQRYLDTKDGHSANETITTNETNIADNWKCEITPNDGSSDGTTRNSSSLTIISNSNLAPDTSLISPLNNSVTSSTDVTFNCSAADNDGRNSLKNITLYGNWTGTWHANASTSVTGTGNSTKFAVNITPGNYSWSCVAYDTNDLIGWANVNRTLKVNNISTHSQPTLTSTTSNNYTTDNLTCYNQSTADTDEDTVTNIYNWYKNGKSIMVLNLPFNHNNSGGTNTTKDYSGYDNNGQLGNLDENDNFEPIYNRSGKVGGAYSFDGGDHIKVPDSNTLDITEGITLEAWIQDPPKKQVSETNDVIQSSSDDLFAISSYCSALGCNLAGNCNDDWISRVRFNTLDHSSGEDSGYADYTAQSTSVTVGQTYTIYVNITDNGGGWTQHAHVWIDYDQDETFEASEKTDLGDCTAHCVLSKAITIPSTATTGTTRMRVYERYNEDPTDPCGSYAYGEAEDYTILLEKNSTIIGKGINAYELGIISNLTIFGFINNQKIVTTSNITKAWHHVVFTYDKTNMSIYIDGKLNNTAEYSSSINTNNNAILIGENMTGSLDEVRIYNHSLSATQIYQRYLDTKDGHSQNQTIVSDETTLDETWKCEITPDDRYGDGASLNSNALTIVDVPDAEALPITGGSFGESGKISADATAYWSNIDANTKTTMKIPETSKLPITSIEFILNKDATEVNMVAESVTTIISVPSGTIYKYVDITTTNIDATSLTSATIKFKVEKDWITRNNIDQDTIRLARLTNTWEALSTKQLDEDSLYVYFEADTPGFSTFAIIADRLTAAELFPEEVEAAKVFEFKVPKQLQDPTLVTIITIFITLLVIGYLTKYRPKSKPRRGKAKSSKQHLVKKEKLPDNIEELEKQLAALERDLLK